MNLHATTNPTQRIGYVDALRGFTMILVVFSHLYIPNNSIVNQVFINFRMPLFFFVSGFITFRVEQAWSGSDLRRRVVEKCRMLLLPALLFGVLYTLVVGKWSIVEFMCHVNKQGYWFTFALFDMLLVYYTLRYVVARADRDIRRCVWLLLALALILRVLDEEAWLNSPMAGVLNLKRMFHYTLFFAVGIIAGCYRATFVRWIARWEVWLCSTALFVALTVVKMQGVESVVVYDVVRAVVGMMGITMVYGLFMRLSGWLDSAAGRAIQYVGRHTLEVYLIHYFLLINFLPMLRATVTAESGVLLPLIVGLPLAIAVATVSLGIGYVLCRIPYVGYYALGRRTKL